MHIANVYLDYAVTLNFYYQRKLYVFMICNNFLSENMRALYVIFYFEIINIARASKQKRTITLNIINNIHYQ